MEYTIKIDVKEFCDSTIESYCIIYDLTPIFNQDGTYTIKEWGVTGDFAEILKWFEIKRLEQEKAEEDKIIEELKNDNLDYVIKKLGK